VLALITATLPSYIWWDFWMFVQNFGSYIGFADQRCECAPHATPTAEFALPQTATVLVLVRRCDDPSDAAPGSPAHDLGNRDHTPYSGNGACEFHPP
jgi:hypothetical protein